MHDFFNKVSGLLLPCFFVLLCCSACVSTNTPRSIEVLSSKTSIEDSAHQEETAKTDGKIEVEKTVVEPDPFDLSSDTDDTYLLPKNRDRRESISSSSAGKRSESPPAVDVAGKKTIFDNGRESFSVNMEDAELYDVVLFFIDLLELNCIIEPTIQGKITIHTSGDIYREDLLPLFYQILEANGMTAVKEGKYYRIVNMGNASHTAIPVSGIDDPKSTTPGMLTQIVPLQSISTEEMVSILTPFMSETGSIISHGESNTLLIIDTKNNMEKLLQLVRTFDVSLLDSVKHRFFWIEHIGCSEVAKTLSELVSFYEKEDSKIKIITLEKLNALLVFSNDDLFFDKIESLIGEIDIPGMDVEPHIYLYFLKNSRAADIVGILDAIFAKNKEEKTEIIKEKNKEDTDRGVAGSNPFMDGKKPESVKKTTKRSFAAPDDYGSGSLRSEMKITQDEIRNVLIIKAIPSDYRIIEKVIKRLDILPRQVMISVTIADIQLDDDMELGVEWNFLKKNTDMGDTPSFFNVATGSAGLLYSVGQLSKWKATLAALAQKKRVDIVATPSILASDNIAASIDISTEIPVASAQIQYDNDNTDKTQTDIQYRNTGIILNVTPHINEYGLVTLEVQQEVSEQSSPVQVGNASYPSFFKRSVKTTLTVNSGQTIAIGGLIREIKTDASAGVPFLSQIPLIGWLFGTQERGGSKSELILLLTPTVIATPDDIDAVTREFTTKIGYSIDDENIPRRINE